MGKLNLANKLTLTRIFLVPLLIFLMDVDNLWTRVFALLIFIGASLTDFYDGRIARKTKTVTTFGIFLDPLADKLIISAALITFVGLKELHIPSWMVVLIISREYVITGLRWIAATKNVVIPANNYGKFKTTSQIVSIIIIFLILIINSTLWEYKGIRGPDLLEQNGWNYVLGMALEQIPFILMFINTVLAIVSGLGYIKQQKSLFRE
jgi:CDP-diacylglycerol---glycerol-3-phosphate 3-phosphatidyltransferase